MGIKRQPFNDTETAPFSVPVYVWARNADERRCFPNCRRIGTSRNSGRARFSGLPPGFYPLGWTETAPADPTRPDVTHGEVAANRARAALRKP